MKNLGNKHSYDEISPDVLAMFAIFSVAILFFMSSLWAILELLTTGCVVHRTADDCISVGYLFVNFACLYLGYKSRKEKFFK